MVQSVMLPAVKSIATTVTYDIGVDDAKQVLIKALGLDPATTTIEFVIREVGGDPMDRFPGPPMVVEIKAISKTKAVSLLDRICELNAKIAALEADAARYRFLRSNPLKGAEETMPYIHSAENDMRFWALTLEDADATIDAAMQAKP